MEVRLNVQPSTRPFTDYIPTSYKHLKYYRCTFSLLS